MFSKTRHRPLIQLIQESKDTRHCVTSECTLDELIKSSVT
jgi:hypothetical protein